MSAIRSHLCSRNMVTLTKNVDDNDDEANQLFLYLCTVL